MEARDRRHQSDGLIMVWGVAVKDGDCSDRYSLLVRQREQSTYVIVQLAMY